MVMMTVRDELIFLFQAAVNSAKPDNFVKHHIGFENQRLYVYDERRRQNLTFDLKNKQIYLIGFGKAVLKMCEEFLCHVDKFNERVKDSKIEILNGILSTPWGSCPDKQLLDRFNVKCYFGAKNNLPDKDSYQTTLKILELVDSAIAKASEQFPVMFINFVSGGGSALLTCPKSQITVEEKCDVISKMVKAGATINELNQMRSCLSQVKGGKLARRILLNPFAECLALIVSDIIDDPIELIASGPTVVCRDQKKPSQIVFSMLNAHKISFEKKIEEMIYEDDKLDLFKSDQLYNVIIGNNQIALDTFRNKALKMGYKVIYLGNNIQGEAQDIGKLWAEMGLEFEISENDRKQFKGLCWLAGGETTVKMDKKTNGIGGRCQEMSLKFYQTVFRHEKEKLYFLAAGTDGQDGPTDVAGCLIESANCRDEDRLKDSFEYLANHDSNTFWKRYHPDCFISSNGPTGTNVMDIYCIVKIWN